VHLTKTAGPAIAEPDLGRIDVVLLSHDHHKDNLDDAGRRLLDRVPIVLTTMSGADRLGPRARPLANWQSFNLPRPGGGQLTITGLPAQHGPDGSERLVGEVTGFLLSGDECPTVYVSGDNASLEVVGEIAERVGAIDVAVLFVGGAQMPYLPNKYLTLPSARAPAAAQILWAPVVIGVHLDGWAHFTDDRESLIRAFDEVHLTDALRVPRPGQSVRV
jgi:L-ascorbate metabolism protein UlaG (beta-lactamase superfamily)